MTTILTACLLVPAGGPAYAGDDISEISGEAADRYKRGRQLYTEGDYEASARELRRAYDQAPYPLLLYNIALAEWRAGQLSRALETARRADEADLPESVEDKNRAMIRGLETRLTAADVADQIPEPTSTADPPQDPAPPPEPDRGLGAAGWTGIGLSTLGVAALGGALWVDRRMARTFDDYRRAAREDRAEYERLNQQLKRDKRFGLGLLGVGVATAGVGAILLVTDLAASPERRAETRSSWRVTLVPTRDPGALLRLRWRP